MHTTRFTFLPAVVSGLLTVGLLAGHAAAQSGHWQLDETSGTVAKDATANANDGTLHNFGGNPWVAGQFGNALSFDGTDDYVEIGIQAGLPIYGGLGSPYSVAFWVKGPPQEDRRVYSEGNGLGNNSPLFTIGTGRISLGRGDKLHVFVRNDAGRVILNKSSDSTVFDDTWHHVAWVDVGGLGQLYVDGVLDTQNYDYTSTNASAGRGTQTPNYGTFTMTVASIGAVLRQSTCCHLEGEVDDLRVYPFALDAGDLSILMTTAAPSFPPCTASIGKFGYGCGGSLDINATGSAQFGQTLTISLNAGTPNATALLLVGAPVTPLDISIAGFPGCIIYPAMAGSILAGIGTLDVTGASLPVNITMPSATSLACAVGAVQGASISGSNLALTGVIIAQLGQ